MSVDGVTTEEMFHFICDDFGWMFPPHVTKFTEHSEWTTSLDFAQSTKHRKFIISHSHVILFKQNKKTKDVIIEQFCCVQYSFLVINLTTKNCVVSCKESRNNICSTFRNVTRPIAASNTPSATCLAIFWEKIKNTSCLWKLKNFKRWHELCLKI